MTDQSKAPLTMVIAEWVARTGPDDVPDQVRGQARRALVDYLAAAVVGSQTATARIVSDYYRQQSSRAVSTVIGNARRLHPAGAAAVNGTAAHALDIDDGYTAGACHPGAPIISAALAEAEARGSDAANLVKAISLGYEVACRLAGASHPAQRNRGFHNTALVGVFGAATAVGALRGFDAETFANAFGVAASHASGLLAFLDQGAEIKRYHAGKAAHDGLVSADLAGAGLTGPTTVLESAHGYFHAFTGGVHDVDHLMGGLGDRWRMLRTYTKPYPCCRHLHGAIEAALAIRDRMRCEAASVDAVVVDTFAIAASHDGRAVSTMLDAQMSLPYTVAAAMVHGQIGLGQFDAEARADPAVLALMERVSVREDAQFTQAYPSCRPARVTVVSGPSSEEQLVMQPLGEPDNPLSDADCDAKFTRLTAPAIGEGRAREIADAAWSLSDLPHLFEVLASVGTQRSGPSARSMELEDR